MRTILKCISVIFIAIIFVLFIDTSKFESLSNLLGGDVQDLEKEEAIVKRVVDGDTVLLKTMDGKVERVRLLMIDTPESVYPNKGKEMFGQEASNFAKDFLKEESKVVLEKGNPCRDRYGRLLSYIWIDDVNFNLLMIEEGYARVAYVFEPNTKYIIEFREAEKQVKKEKLNIWSIEGYVTDDGFDISALQ